VSGSETDATTDATSGGDANDLWIPIANENENAWANENVWANESVWASASVDRETAIVI
jgi:hypothetical protein